MKTNLTLKINSGLVDGKGLALSISDSKCVLWATDSFQSTESEITVAVELPVKLEFTVKGRLPSDTVINENGDVVADKFLSLIWFKILDKPIYVYNIDHKILKYQGEEVEPGSPAFYWNRDGVATLTIDQNDPLVWLLEHPELW